MNIVARLSQRFGRNRTTRTICAWNKYGFPGCIPMLAEASHLPPMVMKTPFRSLRFTGYFPGSIDTLLNLKSRGLSDRSAEHHQDRTMATVHSS